MRRLRILVLSILVILWISVWWFTKDQKVSEKALLDGAAAALSNQDPAWAREDIYYALTNSRRAPQVFNSHQTTPPVNNNSDKIRVLVIGDSFTAGQGLVDLDARWPRQLENILNTSTAPGTFEITTLARQGANTTSYATWIQKIRSKDPSALEYFSQDPESLLKAFSEPFDVVVYGFVDNDYLVNDYDSFVPKNEYVDVPIDDWTPVVQGFKPNPNEAYFLKALDYVINAFDPAQFILLPLSVLNIETEPNYVNFGKVRASGVYVEEPIEQSNLGKRYVLKDLMVTPVDTHPGTAWHLAIAKDAARAVLKKVPAERLDKAKRSGISTTHPLVSNYLPGEIEVSASTKPESVQMLYKGTDKLDIECGEMGVSYDRSARCDPERFQVGDVSMPVQQVPCAKVGAPNALIMFDPSLKEGTKLSIRSTGVNTLSLYSYGYDAEGFEKISTLVDLNPGSDYTFKISSLAKGLVLSSKTRGCPVDSPLVLPSISLVISLK